jgi:hypothetical protein
MLGRSVPANPFWLGSGALVVMASGTSVEGAF